MDDPLLAVLNPHIQTLLGAGPLVLVNWWKPLVLLLPLIGWAWVVSGVLDKHAARFFLPRDQWNLTHLIIGLAAVAAALFMPLPGELGFWMAFLALVVLLVADIAIFAAVSNKDDRIPAEHHLTLDFSKWAAARQAKATAKKQGKVELVVRQPDKTVVPPPATDAPDFEVRTGAEGLFLRAVEARASQLDIGPTGNKDGSYGVVMLIDGVKQGAETMPTSLAVKIIDFWKTAAKLDLADRRRKLTDDSTIERGADKRWKVRVTSSGSQAGLRLSLLFDPEQAVRRKIENLGLLEPQLAELRELATAAQGVVLLAAPAHGGRTTQLYSVAKLHDAYTQNVQTIEMEIQDALEGIRQNKFDPQAEGPEYSALVRSILRRDPDVVAVAELIDQATAKEIARADQERTRSYLSLRADSALQAIQLWMKSIGDPDAGSACLHGVMAGKLLRKLCTNCRVPYAPTPDMLKKLNLPPDKVKQLFKKGGQVIIKKDPETCPVCRGLGYVGQEGAFEVYRLGDPERELIKAGNWNGLRAELRKRGLPTIQTVALRRAVEGTTSVEEVLRVTAEPQPHAGAAKPGEPSSKPSVGSKPAPGGTAPQSPPKPAANA